jgi:hypothetical protein
LKCTKSGYFKIAEDDNDFLSKIKSYKSIQQLENLFKNDHGHKLLTLQQHLKHILTFKKNSFYPLVNKFGGIDLLTFDPMTGKIDLLF